MEVQQNQFALNLIAYAVQRDISAVELCKNANIDLAAIKKSTILITKKQMDDLWLYATRLGNDSLFGLHFGESLQLSALGVIGEIIKNSNTVGEAITIAASLTHLVTDLFQMEITRSKQTFTIKLIANDGSESVNFTAHQMSDLLMVFIVHELDGLILEKIKPRSVVFPYTVSDPLEYERVLRCKPLKKRNEYALSFDLKYWDEPILSANYELQRLLLQKVQASKNKTASGVFSEKIHQYLMANAYLGILSLEDVAANFNVAPRSLQRKLQEEGVTFQYVSDSVRKSLAIHYIESGKHQIKEISNMLGYNELSAFSRAFKRWTGKAPLSYYRN